MITYANQKTVTVHKPSYTENFLQVSKDEWMDAFANLTRSGYPQYIFLFLFFFSLFSHRKSLMPP